jgi:hypothetical protein
MPSSIKPTDHGPRKDPRGGMSVSGTVRGTADYMGDCYTHTHKHTYKD